MPFKRHRDDEEPGKEDTEGQAMRGNRDDEGDEQDTEGRAKASRFRDDEGGDTEGHAAKVRFRDDESTEDSEQGKDEGDDVEGHRYGYSDLHLKSRIDTTEGIAGVQRL